MESMKQIYEETQKSLGAMGKESPAVMQAFMKLGSAVEGPGALDTKTKELITVGVAIKTQCKYCIAWHVKAALDARATRQEIIEAGNVAVLMGGGPCLMYMQELMKALDEFKK